jgi:hypothetical protein
MEDQVEKNSQEEKTPSQETKKSKRQKSPALVITFQSWATPIVGLVMLLVGLLGGYFLRPAIPAGLATTSSPSSSVVQTQQARPTVDPTAAKQLMDYLVSQVKHFQGDANAPVTMIEFSDFQ